MYNWMIVLLLGAFLPLCPGKNRSQWALKRRFGQEASMQQKQNGSCCRLLDKIIGTFLRWKSSEPFYKYCVWKIKFSSDLNLYFCSAAFTYQDGWVQGLKHQPGDQRSALQPLPPLAA